MRRPPIFPPLSPSLAPSPVAAVVAFGANLGDREETIRAAAERIARLPLVTQVQLSTPIESVAVRIDGPDPDAPAYVNAVAIVTTTLAPQILLGMLLAIETEFGRERAERWGDRTLDLDLISYGDVQLDDDTLHLPHPRAVERLFVLEPWLEVDPDAVLLGHGPVADLVAHLRAANG